MCRKGNYFRFCYKSPAMRTILQTLIFYMSSTSLSYSSEPKNWQLGFQESVTSIMNDVVFMHDYILMPIITAISVFVLFLLFYVCIKFRERDYCRV